MISLCIITDNRNIYMVRIQYDYYKFMTIKEAGK